MTSLTTLCATSGLMHRPDERRHAAPDAVPPPRLLPRGAKLPCAVVSVVISLTLLGSVAVGITTPTTIASAVSASAAA